MSIFRVISGSTFDGHPWAEIVLPAEADAAMLRPLAETLQNKGLRLRAGYIEKTASNT